MTDLEKYIISHHDDFEVEPDEKHLMRFQQKLKSRHHRNLLVQLWPATKIAVVIVLVIFTGMWIFDHTTKQSTVAASLLPVPEYAEAEQYFASQVDLKYNQIRSMGFLGDSIQHEIMLDEIAEMDTLYLNLKRDFNANPGDERILQAMIEYYQLKLDVLNNIIQQLNTLQQQSKLTDHEETNL